MGVPTSWIFKCSNNKLSNVLTEILQTDITKIKPNEDKKRNRHEVLISLFKSEYNKYCNQNNNEFIERSNTNNNRNNNNVQNRTMDDWKTSLNGNDCMIYNTSNGQGIEHRMDDCKQAANNNQNGSGTINRNN